MKGLMFTEFLGMVEADYSPDFAEELLESVDLPSGGIYTAVGDYDPTEFNALVQALADSTGTPVDDILYSYGRLLFHSKGRRFPWSLDAAPTLFDYLEGVDRYMQAEVRKLYPDADMPSLTTERDGDQSLTMDYRSPHQLAVVAAGIIDAAVEHFEADVIVTRHALDAPAGAVRFTFTPTARD